MSVIERSEVMETEAVQAGSRGTHFLPNGTHRPRGGRKKGQRLHHITQSPAGLVGEISTKFSPTREPPTFDGLTLLNGGDGRRAVRSGQRQRGRATVFSRRRIRCLQDCNMALRRSAIKDSKSRSRHSYRQRKRRFQPSSEAS